MKKTYICPKTEVIKTKTESILETSPTGTSVFDTSANSSHAVLSRDRGSRTYSDNEDLW